MLRNDEDLLVSLKKELVFIESYYVLLKARYGDGITVSIHVTEDAENCLLPPLSLQAIFENALSRNIIQKASPLKITIQANDNRQLIIKNNIQLKTVTNAFDYELGLDNLVSKYRLLNQGDLIIADTAHERIIQLPLINSEAEVMA
jgi:LytS/YehU family sensor histidine kinase